MTIPERLYLLTNSSPRKLTLFACRCLHEIWHLLSEECQNAIKQTEAYLEGSVSKEEVHYVPYGFRRTDSDANRAAYFTTYFYIDNRINGDLIIDAINSITDAVANKESFIVFQHQLLDCIFGE